MFPTKFSPERIAQNMIDLIAKRYSYLVIRQKEFEEAKKILQSGVSDVVDLESMRDLSLRALRAFGDGHIRLVHASGFSQSAGTFNRLTNFSQYVSDGYLSSVEREGPITVGAIDDVFYIGIESFDKRQQKAFDWLYARDQPKQRKFVVDLRANSGGNDSLGKGLVGFLQGNQGPITASYLRFRESETDPAELSDFRPRQIFPNPLFEKKQVVVLVGGRTCSCGEIITMDLAAIPGAILVGDVSGGSSGWPKRYLADGPKNGEMIDSADGPEKHGARFALDLPSWLNYRIDQRLLEGNGVEPHIKIAPADSIKDGRDFVLEKALEVHNHGYVSR